MAFLGRLILTADKAARAWEIALRVKELGNRLGVAHGISQSLPEHERSLDRRRKEDWFSYLQLIGYPSH